jgi:Holliday junction resolvase
MTDLDELMRRDPLELSAQDIDEIIAYHRKYRGKKALGEKIEKREIDLTALLGIQTKTVIDDKPFRRR